MPRINLLPWRDEQRKERKLRFGVWLVGAAVGACVTAFVGWLLMTSMVSAQDSRNAKLKEEISELDKQIEKINSLEADKARFIARMRLKFEGVAQSSTRVSAFMRNIDGSNYLKNPELEVVETKKDNVVGATFVLYADQSGAPAETEATDANKPKRRIASAGGYQ